MSKKKKRPFPVSDDPPKKAGTPRVQAMYNENRQSILEGDRVGGVFGFFRDYGVRETIESILIAVVLALMFRAYEAEAFIIPTGSMAPTLQGQHMDVTCEKCGYQYRTGASFENSSTPPSQRDTVINTVCPICQYNMRMARKKNPEHKSYNGDRILVNKFVYDFAEPERFDVIVFKNPNNGKQNYIKRLIGLPNENLLIDSGDIYKVDPDGKGSWINKRIVRKPPHKLRVMLQEVDDTNFIAPELKKVDWPSRWQQWSDGDAWQVDFSGETPNYRIRATDQVNWLRYRHLIPRRYDWDKIEAGTRPKRIDENQTGQIIGDYYCYNDRTYAKPIHGENRSPGNHWVGDLASESWLEVKSDSGTLLLDIVEGGAHYLCSIDIATGIAELSSSDDTVTFMSEDGNAVPTPTAKTRLNKAGKYHIVYANADDRIYLWINNRFVKFDAPFFQRESEVLPRWSPTDSGDAEPAGIGAKDAEINVTRLKILRDVYYSSTLDRHLIQNESGFGITKDFPPGVSSMAEINEDPSRWETPAGKAIFREEKGKTKVMFPLENDQFLPMGDNSPASLDGRVWQGPKYVPREMMIGRAMFIYWPHSLRKPLPFFPNFGRMGFIR